MHHQKAGILQQGSYGSLQYSPTRCLQRAVKTLTTPQHSTESIDFECNINKIRFLAAREKAETMREGNREVSTAYEEDPLFQNLQTAKQNVLVEQSLNSSCTNNYIIIRDISQKQ